MSPESTDTATALAPAMAALQSIIDTGAAAAKARRARLAPYAQRIAEALHTSFERKPVFGSPANRVALRELNDYRARVESRVIDVLIQIEDGEHLPCPHEDVEILEASPFTGEIFGDVFGRCRDCSRFVKACGVIEDDSRQLFPVSQWEIDPDAEGETLAKARELTEVAA